jgi:hypothetical protein
MRKTGDRNREMMAAFDAGKTIEQLACDYRLTEDWVRTVLAAEKQRRLFSPEPFYRELRSRSNMMGGHRGSRDS